MNTMQPDSMPGADAQQSEPPDSDEGMEPHEAGEGTFSITVVPNPDGTFDVNGERLDSIELALKMIIKLVREHPAGESQQQHFRAGYQQTAPEQSGY